MESNDLCNPSFDKHLHRTRLSGEICRAFLVQYSKVDPAFSFRRQYMGSRWVLVLCLLTTTALLGQSPPPVAGSEPSVQTLLDRIQQLEARISQLEDHERKQEAIKTANVTPPAAVEPQAANATQTAAPTTPPPVPQAEDHEHMGEMRESTERHYPSLQI